MSRLRRIATFDRIFFVTTNLLNPKVSLSEQERDSVLDVVASQHARGAFWLYGYVVMPTHIRLVLRPHNADVSQGMRAVKSISALRVMSLRKEKGPLWQPRYFDNIIRHAGELWKKLEYIHNNPLVAGLVARTEQWRWSSINAYIPQRVPPIPTDKPLDLPADEHALLWPAP
jgi:REP-associated tyrosine transposase